MNLDYGMADELYFRANKALFNQVSVKIREQAQLELLYMYKKSRPRINFKKLEILEYAQDSFSYDFLQENYNLIISKIKPKTLVLNVSYLSLFLKEF